MEEMANPKQPFFITNKVEISPRDLRILVKLYQPLVGSLALALYLSLNEDYEYGAMLSDAHGVYTLQEQLDCDIKKLFGALRKLEAVGLVETRILDNEVMGRVLAFHLAAVPSSSDFFATALLASLLKEKVGITSFQKLSHDFAQESHKNENYVNGLKEAENVSASFMEVFRLPEEEAIDPSPDVKQAAQENRLSSSNKANINDQDNIDWEFMKQQFEIYQIAGTEIDKNKAAIRSIMRTYGLSEQDFVDEALPCLRGDYQLNMTLVKQTIANNIHADSTRKLLKEQTQAEGSIDAGKTHFSPKDQQALQQAQAETPSQFLYKLKTDRHDFVDASEYRVLDDLYNQKGIPAELLNILTYACLKSGPNVSYRLANKILHDWLQHGVKNGSQAIEYMMKREQNKGKYQRYPAKKKRVEQGTDWSKHKAEADTDVSAEDLKKLFKNLEDQTGLK